MQHQVPPGNREIEACHTPVPSASSGSGSDGARQGKKGALGRGNRNRWGADRSPPVRRPDPTASIYSVSGTAPEPQEADIPTSVLSSASIGDDVTVADSVVSRYRVLWVQWTRWHSGSALEREEITVSTPPVSTTPTDTRAATDTASTHMRNAVDKLCSAAGALLNFSSNNNNNNTSLLSDSGLAESNSECSSSSSSSASGSECSAAAPPRRAANDYSVDRFSLSWVRGVVSSPARTTSSGQSNHNSERHDASFFVSAVRRLGGLSRRRMPTRASLRMAARRAAAFSRKAMRRRSTGISTSTTAKADACSSEVMSMLRHVPPSAWDRPPRPLHTSGGSGQQNNEVTDSTPGSHTPEHASSSADQQRSIIDYSSAPNISGGGSLRQLAHSISIISDRLRVRKAHSNTARNRVTGSILSHRQKQHDVVVVPSPTMGERPYWRAEHDRIMQEAVHREQQGTVDQQDSVIAASAHTAADERVRAVYEHLVRKSCDDKVHAAVAESLQETKAASHRACSEWLYRQILSEIGKYKSDELVFLGIQKHIQSGQPVSLDALQSDDVDAKIISDVLTRAKTQGGSLHSCCVDFGGKSGYSNMTYAQLGSLAPRTWLNDQVINNYLQLLCDSANTSSGNGDALVTLGTHFYAKVESELSALMEGSSYGSGGKKSADLPKLPPQNALLRWLRRRSHILLPFSSHCSAADSTQPAAATTSVRTVLVPVNISGQHWALAVWHKDDTRHSPMGQWRLYDSLTPSLSHPRGLKIIQFLSHALQECGRHLCASGNAAVMGVPAALAVALPFECPQPTSSSSPIDTLFPYKSMSEARQAQEVFHECTLKRARCGNEEEEEGDCCAALDDATIYWCAGGSDKMPQQRNGHDCGVFVCMSAWCVSQGCAVSYSHADAAAMRRVILLELWQKKLLQRLPTAHTSSSRDICAMT